MKCNVPYKVPALLIGAALILLGAVPGQAQSRGVTPSPTYASNSSPSAQPSVQKGPNSQSICAPALKESESSSSYVIGPGDVLAINIWKDAELSRTMPVRPDGKISLPVLGELQAAGLSALQLQTQICERLVDYVRNPQVNVIVAEIKSRAFNVVGRVLKAGTFELVKPTTVLDAIAAAGGFQEFARQTKIYVLRNEPDSSTVIFPFNYKQVIRGRRPDENVQLLPGDTVVVP